MPDGNLYAGLPEILGEELFESLLERPGLRLERIISLGQATPPGQWYDQPGDEWVVLLRGRAALRFEDGDTLTLGPGDFVLIPAHRRHRVEWTDAEEHCLWLALHLSA